MKIGIIGAMEEEVNLLKETIQNEKICEKAGLEFYEGLIDRQPVVVVRSGIGKVNAALCTQILIDDFEVGAIINVGVAGALSDELEIGDMVLSTELIQHDFDVRGFGYPKGEIPRMDTSVFTGDMRLIEAAEKAGHILPDVNIIRGRVATGDVFVSDKGLREQIATEFGTVCAEMEGAAIAQVCHLNKMPVLVIRSMSDKANGEAMESYSEFEQLAAMNSKKLILEILKQGGLDLDTSN